MPAPASLTAELRTEVLALEDDLRARVDSLAEVQAAWRGEYDEARAAERTSAAWEAWRDERVTLAAVAWVITTVFVRFCEDNGLVGPVWITHAGGRAREATDAQSAFLREAARTNPDVTDREWLLEAVEHLRSLPATAGLVDETSPMWLVSPSGDAAARLLAYWRERDDDGALLRDLADDELDTRFLGDLYQDVSEAARKRYALLQTPVFVEEFILDRTLEPALAERPLEGFKAIDPTCGSGHFLLGIFARLLDRWHTHAPAMDERERVQVALDAVHGVDLNPYAVAIARFRLTVAALQACGISSLEDAPAFRYHLAAGDSLLHGLDQGELDLGAHHSTDRVSAGHAYATENLTDLQRILRNGQYDCVVGNPPYIAPPDKSLNQIYRALYRHSKGKYTLVAPFMEKFFSLARSGKVAGWVGKITGNGFIRREFGVALIEDLLPTLDLKLVADSEGAWIPGHNMDGTPTVILIGQNRRPTSSVVRAVLGKGRRENPENVDGSGPYWSDMVANVDDPTFESQWVAILDLARERLAKHPWTLSGGGEIDLVEAINDGSGNNLSKIARTVGVMGMSNADDAFFAPAGAFQRKGVEPDILRRLVTGDLIRDFAVSGGDRTVFPYDGAGLIEIEDFPGLARWLWPTRTELWGRTTFSKMTYREEGRSWWEWHQISHNRVDGPLIAFAFIASHNHFVLDASPRICVRSAPIVQLGDGVSLSEYLGLFGLLNSSTVAFWLRQHAQPKGGAADIPWSRTFEFTGTTLGDYPLPTVSPHALGSRLHDLSQLLADSVPSAVVTLAPPVRAALDLARASWASRRAEMLGAQEELDWEVYKLYRLAEGNFTYAGESPPLALGERAFEIALARRVAAGEEETAWFSRHGSTPITEIPSHWPADYQALVQRRLDLIASDPHIGLLEKPEHKRRWATVSWEKQEERALRGWLLDRLEERRFWFDGQGRPTPMSVAQLADAVTRDADMVGVLRLWEGRPDVGVVDSLTRLLSTEAVPFLAAQRHKEPGLRKRATWEHTWELQRLEDAGVDVGTIPMPTKYTSADFMRAEYWSHRGKLDVPKERFILYPGAGRDTDATPVLGWAGWDHAEQSLALATLIQAREGEGWDDARLVPLVAGLAELLPWVRQWHDQPVDLYGGTSPADFFTEQLEQRMAQVGATEESLKAWRPEPARRGRKAKA